VLELNTLIPGLTYEQYAAEPGLRASHLKLFMRSPAHWKAAQSNPEPPSDALKFGQLFHMAVERGKEFMDRYFVEPEFIGKTKDGRDSTRSAEAKQMRAEWYQDLPKDAVVVKREWVEPLKGMIKSCLEHHLVSNLIRDGVRETSLWVKDPETGLTLQCRPDFISSEGYMVDFKTTRNAHPNFFRGQIFSNRNESDPFYCLSAAHYTHCARVAGLRKSESFIIVAIEKEPPYGIIVYPLDIGCLGPGEQWREKLTKKYAECINQDKWPSYPEQAYPLTPPDWVSLPDGEGDL